MKPDIDAIKKALLRQAALQKPWGALRRLQLHREYEERRERYHRIAEERGLVYREEDIATHVRARLGQRGYAPVPRAPGQVHTFAFIPDLGWHRHLLPDLRELGPLTVFDYVSQGFNWDDFHRAGSHGLQSRREMNEKVLPALRQAHREHPIDWVFVYASGLEISAETIRAITEELGVPTVNMCLDDKQSWTGPFMGDHPAGQVGIAGSFDIAWTSATVACEWYLVEGGRPLYMPEGFDISTYRPLPVEQDIPVSFIGGAYGFRPQVVHHLQRHNVPIEVFGGGWGTRSVWADEQVEIINRSRINLGMGGIGYSESLTNVKTRDFEIPGAGGGMYLTSYNSDLAQHFVLASEIACYRNQDELLELIRFYLAHPDESREVARRGRDRCLREHRWLHRYQRVLEILGVLEKPADSTQSGQTSAEARIPVMTRNHAG